MRNQNLWHSLSLMEAAVGGMLLVYHVVLYVVAFVAIMTVVLVSWIFLAAVGGELPHLLGNWMPGIGILRAGDAIVLDSVINALLWVVLAVGSFALFGKKR